MKLKLSLRALLAVGLLIALVAGISLANRSFLAVTNATNASLSANVSGQYKRLGLTVGPLTPAEMQQAGVMVGLLVSAATGPAAQAGIEPGDVILGLNDRPVDSVEELISLVDKADEHFSLMVKHRDKALDKAAYVLIDLS